ncbi:hypothetical protein GCM10009133_16180 [Cocleimonas flava]|uniref:Uncharacterized protein n=1 Tax=Cocleimonas flava TaxID=634765 RepID=A0A4R1EZ71_9GAMM|nr:hypothetical protein [Cocleimonas flava]TCJ84548.1 hypothetical protein EV695_2505 [Cocleimonas flava]
MKKYLNTQYAVVGESHTSIIEYIEALIDKKLETSDDLNKGLIWRLNLENPELHVELSSNIDPSINLKDAPEEYYYVDYKYRDCKLLLNISGHFKTVEMLNTNLDKKPNFRIVSQENYSK